MDIDNFRATKVDASCNFMSIEFGVDDGTGDGKSINCDKKTAYGRYLLYMVRRDAVNGSGKITWRYLGILPKNTVTYLLALDDTLNVEKHQWRPNTPTEFRKLMTYARKMEKLEIKIDDDSFPIIEKHYEKYAEIKQMEKIVK